MKLISNIFGFILRYNHPIESFNLTCYFPPRCVCSFTLRYGMDSNMNFRNTSTPKIPIWSHHLCRETAVGSPFKIPCKGDHPHPKSITGPLRVSPANNQFCRDLSLYMFYNPVVVLSQEISIINSNNCHDVHVPYCYLKQNKYDKLSPII